MARIITSLLHRPRIKRALRIPVGGHTETTLLRAQPEVTITPDSIATYAETFEVEVLGYEAPLTEALKLATESPESEIVLNEENTLEALGAEEPQNAMRLNMEGFSEYLEEEEVTLDSDTESEEPEEDALEKFDFIAFLAQNQSKIKAVLASGSQDHHLALLTEYETAGAARKSVLTAIAGRAQV